MKTPTLSQALFITINLLIAIILIAGPVSIVSASNTPTPKGNNTQTPGGNRTYTQTGINNPLPGNKDLATFLKNILRLVFIVGTVVVVFFIVLAGFKYVTAQGDPKKITDAHNMLLWTAVGAAVLLGAQTIADVIANTVKDLAS